jgi:hypothetical protein
MNMQEQFYPDRNFRTEVNPYGLIDIVLYLISDVGEYRNLQSPGGSRCRLREVAFLMGASGSLPKEAPLSNLVLTIIGLIVILQPNDQ